jgi:hypothetical protein
MLAAALGLALSVHTTKVHAAKHPAALAQPAVYLATPTLHAAAADAILLDDGPTQRVSGPQQNSNLVLPPVESFTLTPPNPAQGLTKTVIAVHFAGSTDSLPSRFPITLDRQNVMVQRSTSDPRTFITAADFNWQGFADEQGRRKQAALNGKMVPVFEGREFLRNERMQFVDPEQILGALQTHQPLQFSQDVLISGTVTVVPDHELMITAIPVVEAVGFTQDPCVLTITNTSGAWTFNTLLQAIACSGGNCTAGTQQGQAMAENMLMGMFLAWQNTNLQVNTFPVPTRNGIGTLGQPGTKFLSNWPIDPNNTCSNGPGGLCPSLPAAPVHLDAIVNRIDLGAQSAGPANGGELRFIFGVTANAASGTGVCSNQGKQLFNIIVEYKVPRSFTALTWAQRWNSLPTSDFGSDYLTALKGQITDAVVTPNACTDPAGNPISCLGQIRTNEVTLGPSGGQIQDLWELRQFQLVQNNGPQLQEVPVFMTPDNSFNFGSPSCNGDRPPLLACNNNGILKSWIDGNQATILNSQGVFPIVPLDFPAGSPFLGGSAFNGGNAFWADQNPTNSEQARVYFSANTCNGCHGGETWVPDFQQVHNRAATGHSDVASTLSNFLLGCTDSTHGVSGCTSTQCGINTPCTETVPDPNPGCIPSPTFPCTTQFGDILRRQNYMATVLGTNQPEGGGMLLPFITHKIGVH